MNSSKKKGGMRTHDELIQLFRKQRAKQKRDAALKNIFIVISCIVFFPIAFLIVLFAGLAKSEK